MARPGSDGEEEREAETKPRKKGGFHQPTVDRKIFGTSGSKWRFCEVFSARKTHLWSFVAGKSIDIMRFIAEDFSNDHGRNGGIQRISHRYILVT